MRSGGSKCPLPAERLAESVTPCRDGSPILVTLVSFWHFAVVRQQALTPSIAFTCITGRCNPHGERLADDTHNFCLQSSTR